MAKEIEERSHFDELSRRMTNQLAIQHGKSPMVGRVLRTSYRHNEEKLGKMIGKGRLRFHELEEVLLDVELAMNNRPLCYQGEDFDQPVITPNMLIRGGHSIQLKEDFENMEPQERSAKRLIHLKRTKEQLRKRWMGEYIKALEERRRHRSDKNPEVPNKGSVVLLKDDLQIKAHWKIGRIMKHIQSLRWHCSRIKDTAGQRLHR
eukprot:gene13878-4828_t